MNSLFICPICHTPLNTELSRWFCENNHSFDVAKQQYVNLLPVNQKKSLSPGDDGDMVAARDAFLSAGHYAPLRDEIRNCIRPLQAKALLDVGCGEGYYTLGLADVVERVIAVDIAKPAVQKTAKKAIKQKIKNIQPIVASAAHVPVADESLDTAVSIFSPILPDELARIIKPNGQLIIAKPAEKHLIELREQLFDDVMLHDSDKFTDQLAGKFTLSQKVPLSFQLQLDHRMLNHLLTMTPYAYKAKPHKRAALESLDSLKVTASFYIYVFNKQSGSVL